MRLSIRAIRRFFGGEEHHVLLQRWAFCATLRMRCFAMQVGVMVVFGTVYAF